MLYWTPESSFVYNNLEEVIIPFDGNKLTFSTFANGEVKEVREFKGQMLLWICPFPIPFVLLAITSNDRRE